VYLSKKKSDPFVISDERKLHYLQLANWLKLHPQIQSKRLYPYGFQIDIRTVPKELEQEFLEKVTFNEKQSK